MDESIDRQILDELIRVRKLLTIATQDKLESFNANIERTYLTTEERRLMYDMFDGENSYKTIAEAAKVSPHTVGQFAIQLSRVGLVEFVEINQKSKNPKRAF